MLEAMQIRIHGADTLPTVVYLPGLHGDWTLVGNFRRQLTGKVRFVELTYPRTTTWSLDEYAVAIEVALAQNGIRRGWLLGESFGSQILWPLVGRGKFSVQGIILAGGFVRHPLRCLVRLAEKIFGRLPFSVMVWAMYAFTKYVRIHFRDSPESLADIDEFAARRTRLDCLAATHRLHLIAVNDPRPVARATALPLFYLTGLFDPVVPWPLVRYWLRKNCPALRAVKVVRSADHNVLGTGSKAAARQVVKWIAGEDLRLPLDNFALCSGSNL
jgi:pimeloyl-ACP methyl ester carboxylesterase